MSDGHRKLAVALVADAVQVLRTDPPSATPPRSRGEHEGWRQKWKKWERERRRDVEFFGSRRAAVWCELAGLEVDAVRSRLEAERLLYDPAERIPVDMSGRSLVHG